MEPRSRAVQSAGWGQGGNSKNCLPAMDGWQTIIPAEWLGLGGGPYSPQHPVSGFRAGRTLFRVHPLPFLPEFFSFSESK